MNLDMFSVVFWDFDGVIKESVSVKTDAFLELFKPYGSKICEKVKAHHIANGGMSRYEKLPLYLKWSGVKPNAEKINELSNQFSLIVKKKVINSDWVPGVKRFIKNNKEKFIFIIVSATPQKELIEICRTINIENYFNKIYGSPMSKSEAIKSAMAHYKILPDKCLMIGDAMADIYAAEQNNINFIFRRHKYNLNLKIDRKYLIINDFDNNN